ncbi:calcium/proton exchanger [Tanacetum coccineum]
MLEVETEEREKVEKIDGEGREVGDNRGRGREGGDVRERRSRPADDVKEYIGWTLNDQAEVATQKEYYTNALTAAKEAEALAEARANTEAKTEVESRLKEAEEREVMLVQTLEELRQTLSRTEQQAVFREDMLRRDIEDLQKRYQESERRCEELVMQVPDFTRPLLRQIEAMQETTARRAEAWTAVERSLTSRLQEAEAKSAAAEERERSVNERLSQTLSRINVLEAQPVTNLFSQAPFGTPTASFNNNDQMSMEDRMRENSIQTPSPAIPAFAPASAGKPVFAFNLGTPTPSPSTSPFQFGVQTNQPPSQNPFQVQTNQPPSQSPFQVQTNQPPSQNPFQVQTNQPPSQNPFQASLSLELHTGGSFSLCSGGGRRIDIERERATRLELETTARQQSSIASEPSPLARTKSLYDNGLTHRLSNASSLGSMEESFFLQASLGSSDTLSERRNHGEPTMSSYYSKSMTPNAFEAVLRQKEGELASYMSRLASMESIRDSLAEELVKMTEECEKLRSEVSLMPGLKAEIEAVRPLNEPNETHLEITDNEVNEAHMLGQEALRSRHSAALELMGERDEELEELRADIVDLKEIYSYETLILKSFNYLKKSLTMVKDQVFTVNLHHDGIFIASPLRYLQGDLKQITDIDFEGMSFDVFRDIIKHLVHGTVYRLYYCPIRTPLNVGIKELKTDSDVEDFVRVGYENKWFVDLYVEHFDYDVMDFINEEANGVLSDGSSDEYYSSDEIEEFDDVDFHTEGEENVVIKNLTTHDPFLNKLCGNNGMFRDYLDESVPETEGEALDDPGDAHIGPIHKAKKVLLIQNMTPQSLGCSRNEYSNKKKKKIKKSLFPDEDEDAESSKPAPKSSKKGAKSTKSCNVGEGSSKSQPSKSPQTSPKTPQTSRKYTKKKIMDAKKSILVCGFRLWASWMHNEHSFQIKSLHDDHKCSRNYKLGSLVTYKWIAYHFSKEIINDPFIPYIKMRDQIRQKFLIDVSLGQCKRAKQRALYNHEGGLIEHYGRLWDYRQALLESNPGLTCRLEVEEVSSESTYFKRFYICFKGLKDGWLDGCRRIIGLDGCFLKHTCRGELLTAMGRDANNQMYPIAWAVVKVENIENWSWFLSLLHDDLNFQQGTGLTLILDSHKTVVENLQQWKPSLAMGILTLAVGKYSSSGIEHN